MRVNLSQDNKKKAPIEIGAGYKYETVIRKILIYWVGVYSADKA